MIDRFATVLVNKLAAQFPAVLILGSRQCGKTTLARYFLTGDYLDLEKPSDQQVFSDDIEFALRQFDGPLIIDEAQTLPDIFPVLRALIDEKRNQTGRYYLLGSVNPALIKEIAESLAGRVGIVDLTPFLFVETEKREGGFADYWLKGGYPDACRSTDADQWIRWQENYVRTFVERDVTRHGLKASPVQIRRLLGMLAGLHGGLVNASEIGRSLGITYHTVNSHLDILEAHYLIRRLQPYYANIGKRLVRSPKIYIRDSGMLHYLLNIQTDRQLLESHKRGSSLEGLVIEQIAALEQLYNPGSRLFFYRTHAGAEVDLIVDRGRYRIGYEIKCAHSLAKRDWGGLKTAMDEGLIEQGRLIYFGEREFDIAERLHAVNIEKFLRNRISMNSL
jgi:predicted AAA+ superfamily ATPase